MRARACGIVFCYNEEDVIRDTIQYYLSLGIDLVIFDNQSTDSSINIVNGFLHEKYKYAGRILELVSIQTTGYDQGFLCRQANDYMHEKLNRYEWIMVIDADEYYASPVRGMSLLEYLDLVKRHKYNIVHGRAYYFYPTEKDDCSIESYSKRMNYCLRVNKYPQEKIFTYHPSVDFHSYYGHCCLRDDRRVCMNPGFILKHYGWISYEQGVKKIFENRLTRYKNDQPIQNQYAYMLPLKSHLVKDSHLLLRYEEERELVSEKQFSLITKIISWYDFILSKLPRNTPGIFKPYSANPPVLFTPPAPRPVPYYVFSNIIDRLIPPDLRSTSVKYAVNAPPLSYPSTYHFLVANVCNASCLFCNQPKCEQKKEITLDKFKVMISHIPMHTAKNFVFSGGGEPLLCRDLFDIIRYVNEQFPNIRISIRTNGLLLEKYAEAIVKANIDQLEISVHGEEAVNDSILRVSNSKVIFTGLELLKKHQRKYNKKILKVFYSVVSRLNINEIPKLLERASVLGIDELRVGCCLYSSQKNDDLLKKEDSVYFHRELHDSVMRKSAAMAKRLKIRFISTRLFSEKFKAKLCSCPWEMLLVDWDGDVYPCGGGEARFYQKVKSGIYHFGNLLHEDVSLFWVNELYTKLRRQLRVSEERHIPECDSCHLSICYKGPHFKESHFVP